ncbi:hypothetical protein [Ectobacillus ponti]|uniref:Uncharacterized protein n=1 Tax=Ectobacillus ponti TaxID=2961894 RepID=A0AA42BPF5_9BACI|nr:hypothetical protein [Ectobacillus ponti]MCP8968697.1 hypothetical protein [Ectobacillus ponti]
MKKEQIHAAVAAHLAAGGAAAFSELEQLLLQQGILAGTREDRRQLAEVIREQKLAGLFCPRPRREK